MTEPDAGSDVRSMTTRAVRDGDDYVVDGSKHFISNADKADFVILFAATGIEETPRGAKKSITGFLVDMDTPGLHRHARPRQRLPPRLPPQRARRSRAAVSRPRTGSARRAAAST